MTVTIGRALVRTATLTAAAIATAVLGLAAAPAVAFDIQEVVSPLGIKALLVEDHSIQLMSMNYAFIGGSSQEPLAKRGITNLMVSMLDEGAGDLDEAAFQLVLEDQAISLSFNADRDAITGSLRTITDTRDEAARLLTIALTQPRFDADPLARLRTSILTAIRNRDKTPSQQATIAFNNALFPGHIYAIPEAGTVDTVGGITVDDMRAFQKRVMARDNLKVVAVGDIDAKTLGALVDRIFGALPAKADLVPVPDAPPPEAKFIDVVLADAAQTSLRFAGAAPKRSDPDYLTAFVATYILGGGTPGTRLYDAVRVNSGLTYTIGLGLDLGQHASWFVGSTSTRADQADQVLRLVRAEIKRYADEGPTADELARAKAYLTGSYALRFTTTGQVASQLMGLLIGNIGIDYIKNRNDLIAAITLDDVRRMARQLFAGDMLVSRVGPAS